MLFLIGYMGCGKSTLGRKLARRLGGEFVDTDSLVEEREGASVADVFRYEGEQRFREVERAVLDGVIDRGAAAVVSTGGGLPVWADNMERMNAAGCTVYLRRTAQQIAGRLSPYGRRKRPRLRDLSDEELVAFMERDMASQLLDTMDIERERGITIKSNAVRVMYTADDGETYQFNLIDTPGHVDFTYEVSRSLAACEGAVLVVDATQGVEAQTVSNANLAINANLDIVPAINKIDLPSAHPDEVKLEIEDELAIPADDAVCVSGKTGEGIHDLLEAIVFLVSAPEGDVKAPLKALILDSYFDEYRGVVATVRIFDGEIRAGMQLTMMQTGHSFLVDGVGVKRPAETPVDALTVGEVGFVVTGLKDPEAVHVGETLTYRDRPCAEPLPGYREAKPMVYTGIFPIDNKDYENLRDALEKLHVNDPSLIWTPETSVALGFGFRVGFLGLLHMEVVKERLEREFDLDLIATSPSVDYHVYKTDGTMLEVRSPQDLPDVTRIDHIEEPYIRAQIISKSEFFGPIMKLCLDRRGTLRGQHYITADRVELNYDMPLSEIVFDFYDRLKTISKGYASFDYHITDYRPAKLVKLDILLNGEPADALSTLIHEDNAYDLGR